MPKLTTSRPSSKLSTTLPSLQRVSQASRRRRTVHVDGSRPERMLTSTLIAFFSHSSLEDNLYSRAEREPDRPSCDNVIGTLRGNVQLTNVSIHSRSTKVMQRCHLGCNSLWRISSSDCANVKERASINTKAVPGCIFECSIPQLCVLEEKGISTTVAEQTYSRGHFALTLPRLASESEVVLPFE